MSKKDDHRKTNTLKDLFNGSSLGNAKDFIDGLWHRNKKLIYMEILFSFIISDLFCGYLVQSAQWIAGSIEQKSFFYCLYAGIKHSLLFVVALTMIINIVVYKMCSALKANSKYDEDRNYEISDEGIYGTAQKMTDAEKKVALIEGTYADITDNILGADIDDPNKLYALNSKQYGINGNVYIVGSPGAGKSRCIAVPDIMQMIRRGESGIIADPKGELYGKTKRMLEAHGYTVKIFDVHPKRMGHSDTVDFMEVIGDDDIMATSFASTIIENLMPSQPEKNDFWASSELNELTFVTLYISTNDINIPKTLGEVYKFINTHDVQEIEDIFDNLDDDHPAKPAFNTWAQGDDVLKGNTHAGLQIHLQKMANKKVQQVTGRKEIDFTAPITEKCMYFVSMSDQDKSFSFLIALFFTLCFQSMVSYYDFHGGKKPDGTNCNKVTVILDEFYSLGKIPNYDIRLSNMRSRGIDCIIITQSLGQLQQMYPDNLWESILDCCSVWILLRTNSDLTAEYFSKRSGEQTVTDKSKRYEESSGDILKIHPDYMVGESHGKTMTYTSHQIKTLDPSHLLVVISSYNVIELKRMDYSNHPMCKEIREVVAAEHKPTWIDETSDEDLARMKIDRNDYKKDDTTPIELCTEDDFKEPWTPAKQKALERKLKKNQGCKTETKKSCKSQNNIGEELGFYKSSTEKTEIKNEKYENIPSRSPSSDPEIGSEDKMSKTLNADIPTKKYNLLSETNIEDTSDKDDISEILRDAAIDELNENNFDEPSFSDDELDLFDNSDSSDSFDDTKTDPITMTNDPSDETDDILPNEALAHFNAQNFHEVKFQDSQNNLQSKDENASVNEEMYYTSPRVRKYKRM